MSEANINIDVNSRELTRLINQLEEADREFGRLRQSGNSAARAVDELGDESTQTAKQVDGLIKKVEEANQKIGGIGGNSNQAARGLDRMGDEAAQAARKIDQVSGGFASMGGVAGLAGGVGAAALAAVAAAAVVAAAAISKYAEETANQETQLNTLLNQTDEFVTSLGATIMESDGAKRVMSLLSGVMVTLTENMNTIGDVITGVVNIGLSILNTAIQTGIVAWAAFRLAAIGAEAILDIVGTTILNLAGEVVKATLAVVGLGTAFAEGLVSAIQMGIDKFGQLIQAIAPFAAKMGIDLSGVTGVLDNMGDGLSTVSAGLQTMRENAESMSLDITEQQAARVARTMDRMEDRVSDANDVIETMGDNLIITDAVFNTHNDTLEENTRLQDENNTARRAAVKDIDAITSAQLGAEKAARSAIAALYEFMGIKPPGPVIKPEPPQDPKIKLTQDLIAAEEEAAARRAVIAATEQREREANLEAFQSDIETRFELLHGYTVNFEDLTTRQIAKLNNMTDNQAEAIGFTKNTFAEVGAASAAALAESAGRGESAGKAIKKVIGQELIARGTSAIFTGAIETAGGNPMGLLKTAAGVAAVAAGAAMGGGGNKSPSTPASTTPGQTQTQYTSVNFGFVGDRRAAGREVADVQEDARRRGL